MLMNPQIKNDVLFSVFIIIVAVLPHLRPGSEGLTLDEADYALAARQGIVANMLDNDNTRHLRHYHGPVVPYLIRLSTAIFGENEAAIRLPNRIIGILTCLLIFWGSIYIVGSKGAIIGFLAALSLAIMPTFVQVSGVANMHPLTAFLMLVTFFLTVKTIQTEKPVFLYILAGALGIMLATMEYGFVASFIVAVVFLITKNPFFSLYKFKPKFSIHVIWAVLIGFGIFFIVWPAGVLKLNLARNFWYYLRYSEHGHPILFQGDVVRHVPGWAYIHWFSEIAPVWLVLSVTSIIFLIFLVIKQRKFLPYRILGVYLLILFIVLLRQHIMSARYAIYLIPFLCIAIGILFSYILKAGKVGTVLVAVLVVAQFATNYETLSSFDRGDPGYRQVAQFLKKEADKKNTILAWYQPILKFYLPEFQNTYNYNSGGANEQLMNRLKKGEFKYVIFYHNQILRWPEDPGYCYVKKHYQLVYTFEKGKKTYLWLYKFPNNESTSMTTESD